MEQTKYTHVLVLTSGTIFYLTKQEFTAVNNTLGLIGSTEETLRIGEKVIMKNAVSSLMPVADYEETLRRKKGEWECNLGHWHTKDEKTCKEVERKKEEEVKLSEGDTVNIKEILKDQAKKPEDREYERDKDAGKWIRKITKPKDDETTKEN